MTRVDVAAPMPPALDTASLLARTIRRDIQDLHAYAVQPSSGLVKLDAMENPYRLPPTLQRALGERLASVAINRYPAGRIDELKTAIAAYAGLPAGCALTLGNGSDELITMLTLASALPGGLVMAPQPTFVMYAMSAALQGVPFVGVPLTPDFELDVPAMRAAIAEHRPTLLYLACPNNPTANLWDAQAIEALIDAMAQVQGLIVIDEAYQPFASRDAMGWLGHHPHLLVMRTLSKFGLAGVRIGYLMGRREIIGEIDKLRPPYNVSVLNAEAALFALEHADEYAHQAQQICAERERIAAQLGALPGVSKVWPSQANMILLRVSGDARRVFEGMKARGVLIKHVESLHPLLAGCLRITVGTPEENERMLTAIAGALTEEAASTTVSA